MKVILSGLNLLKQSQNNCCAINYYVAARSLATHWDPKFKRLRKAKFIKPELPDFNEILNQKGQETTEERKARYKKQGMEPSVSFEYKPVSISSSTEIFDPYIPPEGDGKASSVLSKSFATQKLEAVKNVFNKKLRHSRVIRKYDESFNEQDFCDLAQEIYINAHKSLAKRDNEELIDFVTENAYSKMWLNMKFKSLKWEWIETLEQPTVTNIVTTEMISKANIFGQITVRFHSKQILAVYDRFGRLAFGDDKNPRDILEYVVFERHLTNLYSNWRMHDKIEPEWAPRKMPIIRTFVQPKPFKIDETVNEADVSKFKKDESHIKDSDESSKKAISSA